ncbi:peptide MFS transporter [Sphingomonas japonica]|uniref:POT family proton-dependent oligopeptide transporter n=1 Tax=Sphingomonas japonica TaxID=511662 RepID=A0ABX0U1J2_9SPHN|nr:peptide MFS transporter [Sphingomonas japonica]NIJ23571.1 POT family proton-dependent oligopeptide transporter [Sphingomonas japonica]
MASAVPSASDGGKEFLGHPRGLFILFFAEMWERFSYYGMRALLIFYLTKHWLFSDGDASVIYGAYTALVYITPVLGGYLADKYLGQRKAVLFGGIILTIGHGLMAFEGTGGQGDPTINIFWLALAFIIVGSGFLKGNISTIVGQLYPRTDVRRDGAYTIFYMGINLGSLLGVAIAGYLGENIGWSYGFGAAGVGMLLGLIVFVIGKPLLLGKAEPRDPALLKKPVAGIPLEWLLYGIGIASIGVIWVLIQYQSVVGTLLLVSGLALLGYILYIAATQLPKDARDRIFVIIFLLMLQPVFWGLFEQAGAGISLFTDRHVDREFLGWTIPTTWFQSVNAAFILLLGPVFATLWTKMGRRGIEPSTPAKFGYAIVFVGLGFLLLVWGAQAFGVENATPFYLIILLYLLHTMGELCLSPVGLSAMNRLAPSHMAGLIMGAWFFATAGGNFIAGQISKATGAENATEGESAKQLFLDIWTNVGWIAVGVGVAVLVVAPFVKRLMHLDTLTDDPDHAMAGEREIGEPKAAGFDTRGETLPPR